MDREKVVKGLECCSKIKFGDSLKNDGYCDECPYAKSFGCGHDLVKDAIGLLKEQEAMLKKAYETLADMDFEFFCDDLMSDDGWCEERCKASGTQPECIERWLRKQISEGSVRLE